jgi:hypothetical protein
LQGVICDHAEDPALDKALEDLAAGRRPFGIFPMFKGGLKAKVGTISIEGRSPSSPNDWVIFGDTVYGNRRPTASSDVGAASLGLSRHPSCLQSGKGLVPNSYV